MTPETKDRLVKLLAKWRKRVENQEPLRADESQYHVAYMHASADRTKSCADELESILRQMDETPAPDETGQTVAQLHARIHSASKKATQPLC